MAQMYTDLLLGTLLLLIVYLATKLAYNIFLHPLSRFPGPLIHKISRHAYLYKHVNGTLPFDMLKLHQKYGDVVRVAPDELAFSHPDAWKDIMGHQKADREFKKAAWFYEPLPSMPRHIVNEDREEHGRARRQLAHGFSEKGIREQEPIIKHYVDLMIEKVNERAQQTGGVVVLSDWFNFCTFDIIGDLAFGESFGCLEKSDYHAWIASIFASGRFGTILQALSFFPLIKDFLLKLVPASLREAQVIHKQQTEEKMNRRMKMNSGRHDLIAGLLDKKNELGMGMDKLVSNAEILIIGGSETTATLLSGATYHILRNPTVLHKLVTEVRTAFASEDEIDFISVNQLKYMLAVLNETLRMYPPIANGLPRQVPRGGATVLGVFVPENTYVAIHHWALYRRPEYFSHPDQFRPERFLDDQEFANDRKDTLQPFHVGPRNCLGRNLAYVEMRVMMARMLYRYDMRLDDASVDWINQKNYLMWQKGPLRVHLSQREDAKL